MIKSIKRNLSAILMFILVLISLPSDGVKAAIKESALNGTDYKMLEAFGIVKESDKLAAEVLLTRGTMIRLAMRATGNDIQSVSDNGENPFTDIDNTNEYYKEALLGYQTGVLSGGNARVYEYATPMEVAKVLCCITGYSELCIKKGGWPSGYMAVSAQLKLMPKGSESVALNEYFRVLVKALETKLLQIESVSTKNDGQIHYETYENATLLTEAFGYEHKAGILQEDTNTSIFAKKTTTDETVVIDGERYAVGTADCGALLGCYVELYYKKDSHNRELVYIGEAENKNKILTVELWNVSDVSEDGSQFTICYGEKEKAKKIELKRNAFFVYNFEQTPIKKELLINEKKAGELDEPDVKCGELRLIDNDLDGEYEVAVVTDYTAMQIAEISAKDCVIVGTDGETKLELDRSDDKYSFDIIKDGKSISFEALKKKDIVLFAQSFGNKKAYKKVIASSNTVKGELSAKGEEYVTINENEYRIENKLYKRLNLSANGIFYLDAFNVVRAVDENEDMVFGYVRAVGEAKGISKKPVMQIFTENNRWVELEMRDKVNIDSSSIKATELTGSKSYILENMVGTLIQYCVNSDGDISKIFTAQIIDEEDIWSDEELSMIDDGIFRKARSFQNIKYRSGPSSFEDNFVVSSDTKIFFIPSVELDEYGQEIPDELTDYYIGNNSNLVHDKAYTLVDVYNLTRNGTAEACVIEEGTKEVAERSQLAVIDGTGMKRFADSELRDAIWVYYGSERVALPLTSADVLSEAGGVVKGDIVQFMVDQNGEISKLSKRFDSSGGFEQKTITNEPYAYATFFSGLVKNVDSAKSIILLDYGTKKGVIYTKNAKVYVYDLEEKRVYPAALDDIYSSQYVFVRANYLQAQEIIIFKQN